MAESHELCVDGHPSIYEARSRKLKIYFSIPDNGINKETGILLLISGYGGHANSKVYKKMRSVFADKYNLVTIQCNYFGWQFMQDADEIDFEVPADVLEMLFNEEEIKNIIQEGNFSIDEILKRAESYDGIRLKGKAILNEDLSNFDDMGIMQAVDNITAILIVKAIIKDNSLTFNQGKIIIFGHSHGAYLSYLCNAFAPDLFSMIIDNSGWLFPLYLKGNRLQIKSYSNSNIIIRFEYLAKTSFYDEELLSLNSLYDKFENRCNIICFQGTTDKLIDFNFKKEFCDKLRITYYEINEDIVDGKVFRSTEHGLDADFLNLFEYIYEQKSNCFDDSKAIQLAPIKFKTDKCTYEIDYSNGVPVMQYIKHI